MYDSPPIVISSAFEFRWAACMYVHDSVVLTSAITFIVTSPESNGLISLFKIKYFFLYAESNPHTFTLPDVPVDMIGLTILGVPSIARTASMLP